MKIKKNLELSHWVGLLLVGLVSSQVFVVQAQTTDGAELRRQQERERALREQFERTPDVRLQEPSIQVAPPAEETPETPCFVINEVEFSGEVSPAFTAILDEIRAVEPAMLGRCLGARGINALLAYAQNQLVARGYVTTRVLAAPQDLKTGVLKLTVIPGRIRNVRGMSDDSVRERIQRLPIAENQLLNLRDIEQSLENFKRVPTADADIQIEPSNAPDAQPGDSDLLIKYQQTFPIRATLSVDDGGSKYTGKYLGSATLSYDNPLGLNDLLYISANHDLGGGAQGARGTKGGSAHYSIPFGYWLISTNYSENDYYQSVAGINQVYRYSGRSTNQDLKVSYLFSRDAVQKSSVSIRTFLRTSNNFIDDTEVEVQRRRTAGWELGVSHRRFIGASTFDGFLSYRQGTGAFGALPAPEQAFGEGTSRMRVFSADLNLVVPFEVAAPWGAQRIRYIGNIRAQYNQTPLTPQDRFAIGNRYTVRGFDGEVTLSADRGWVSRNEIAFALGPLSHEVYLGVDYGEVGGQSAQYLPGRSLTGAVIGLRGALWKISYDIFTGAPLDKPKNFPTSGQVAGFNLIMSF